MNTRSALAWAGRLSAGVVLALGSSFLVGGGKKPAFTTQDKAYYADANLVAFVRPGLEVQIVSASIAADGTIKVHFKISDPKDLPLATNRQCASLGPSNCQIVANHFCLTDSTLENTHAISVQLARSCLGG